MTLDPHKWLYQPLECGSLLVREGRLLEQAFAIAPDYLRDAVGHEGEVDFGDLGLQLSRSFRALKVWLSVSHFGVAAFRAAIDRSLDLAELARRAHRGRPAAGVDGTRASSASRASGGAVDGDEDEAAAVNAALVAAYEATGRGLVSSTRLRGRYAVRLCPMNHTTTAADVEDVLEFFATAAVAHRPSPNGGARRVRRRRRRRGWLGAPEVGRRTALAPRRCSPGLDDDGPASRRELGARAAPRARRSRDPPLGRGARLLRRARGHGGGRARRRQARRARAGRLLRRAGCPRLGRRLRLRAPRDGHRDVRRCGSPRSRPPISTC